ncbi:carbonic anhydrase [Paenibacillus sp. NEAU-GSW1]|uniref:beta-class carbonic anhydrase n=1 Tax=Paenibacillus sp. NEAU-GSW1 TaxID=2682486 RepID=UPI0012E209A4|nr:carbonic anhydrase [Paenibacillus sp. NEAU-GSW1]MUT65366.1 carbonic anhydrase [Paenibacillus sp. NEAU-GSW1]
MNKLEQVLSHNSTFVENKSYEQYLTTKFPDRRMVIVTCMDARLTELLPKAMNLKNGDAKIIKSAGGIVTQPFGNLMRSVLVAVYELKADEVFVIGHHDCGMTGINPETVIGHMIERGIPQQTIATLRNSGVDLNRWLTGFDNLKESVEKSVSIVRNHPLLPSNVPVHGLTIHPDTGALDLVVNGYNQLR